MKYYAICDCDNIAMSVVSASFVPTLKASRSSFSPITTARLFARSAEAKRLGIKAGTPYYQLGRMFPGVKIEAFSSSYELPTAR